MVVRSHAGLEPHTTGMSADSSTMPSSDMESQSVWTRTRAESARRRSGQELVIICSVLPSIIVARPFLCPEPVLRRRAILSMSCIKMTSPVPAPERPKAHAGPPSTNGCDVRGAPDFGRPDCGDRGRECRRDPWITDLTDEDLMAQGRVRGRRIWDRVDAANSVVERMSGGEGAAVGVEAVAEWGDRLAVRRNPVEDRMGDDPGVTSGLPPAREGPSAGRPVPSRHARVPGFAAEARQRRAGEVGWPASGAGLPAIAGPSAARARPLTRRRLPRWPPVPRPRSPRGWRHPQAAPRRCTSARAEAVGRGARRASTSARSPAAARSRASCPCA